MASITIPKNCLDYHLPNKLKFSLLSKFRVSGHPARRLATYRKQWLGRMEEAQQEVKEILRMSPYFSIEILRGLIPSKDKAIVEEVIEAFRKAGLK
jgi:hypothetical protein